MSSAIKEFREVLFQVSLGRLSTGRMSRMSTAVKSLPIFATWLKSNKKLKIFAALVFSLYHCLPLSFLKLFLVKNTSYYLILSVLLYLLALPSCSVRSTFHIYLIFLAFLFWVATPVWEDYLFWFLIGNRVGFILFCLFTLKQKAS